MCEITLRVKPYISIFLKTYILVAVFCLIAVRATEYETGNYDYDYYGDNEPLYEGGEYVEAEPGLTGKNSNVVDQSQLRRKKDLALDELNWINRSLSSLAAPECAKKPVTTTKATTTECAFKTTKRKTTTTSTCQPECAKKSTDCISLRTNLDESREGSGPNDGLSANKSKLSSMLQAFRAPTVNNDQEEKTKELRNMVQRLYVAQARVQLEASEIKKAQAIANEAQLQLEESANHVRAITAALQNAQQEVASSAIRAQTAQLQLAAHDQLLFAARQDVDALSSQMVGLQAAEGIAQPKASFDITALMDKLRQPLLQVEKPTPVPALMTSNQEAVKKKKQVSPEYYYEDEYVNY